MLTPRESEVMRHVTKGLLNKQVAGEMGLAEITVKIHRGNVIARCKHAPLPTWSAWRKASGCTRTSPDGRQGRGKPAYRFIFPSAVPKYGEVLAVA